MSKCDYFRKHFKTNGRWDSLIKIRFVPPVYLFYFFVDDKFSKSRLSENLKNPDIARVIYAEEFEKANPQDIVDLCYDFHRKIIQILDFWLMVLTQALLDS
jgi:hypothetical protein